MTGHRFPGLKTHCQHVRAWLGRFAVFGAGQVAVQSLTAITGFLSVRWLSKQEYAFFTIATSLQFLVCHFSDMGVTIGINSIGGQVWNDPTQFGSLLNTARRERVRVAFVASFAVVPFVFLLLVRQECGCGYAAALTLCSLAAGLCQMESGVFSLAPRFHGQLQRLRRLDVGSSFARLILMAALLALFPVAVVPVTITGVISLWQLRRYRQWSEQLADRTAAPDPAYRTELRRVVLRLMPSSIYYVFEGQLSVAIIAFFGARGAVADVGALSRLGIVFAVIGTTTSTVLMPAFAKVQDRRRLVARFWLLLGAITALTACIVCLAILFRHECLWLLGAKYRNLESEVPVVAISGGLGCIQAAIWNMVAARSWVDWAWLHIPVSLLTLVVCIPLLNVQTVHGILLLGCYSLATTILSNLCMAWQGFRKTAGALPPAA